MLSFDRVFSEFWLSFDWVLTEFWLSFDWVLTELLQSFDRVLTEFWLSFDWVLTEFGWILTDFWPSFYLEFDRVHATQIHRPHAQDARDRSSSRDRSRRQTPSSTMTTIAVVRTITSPSSTLVVWPLTIKTRIHRCRIELSQTARSARSWSTQPSWARPCLAWPKLL